MRLRVIAAVPLPTASALVMAGTSLDGSSDAVNFTVFGFVVVADVGDFEPLVMRFAVHENLRLVWVQSVRLYPDA